MLLKEFISKQIMSPDMSIRVLDKFDKVISDCDYSELVEFSDIFAGKVTILQIVLHKIFGQDNFKIAFQLQYNTNDCIADDLVDWINEHPTY